MAKSPKMENIELRRGRPLEELIREQVEAGKTQEQIANDLGVSYWTFRSWLRTLGARASIRFAGEEVAR